MPTAHQAPAPTPSDLWSALETLGVEVVRESRGEYWALCPMHEARVGKPDSDPSWSINQDTGLHNCFSCGYRGSFVGLVMDVLGFDFPKAAQWVRHQGADIEVLEKIPSRMQWRPAQKVSVARREPEERLRRFSPEPPETALAKRQISQESVDMYGVMWDSEQRGWILPVRTPDGKLYGYQFKRGVTVKNKPMNMKKSITLFGIDVFVSMRCKRMVVVESPLDVLKLYTDGVTGAVSTFGSAVSTAQMNMMVEHTEHLIAAMDNDKAGWQSTNTMIETLVARLRFEVFNYGKAEGKDPGELTRVQNFFGVNNAKHALDWSLR